MEKNINKNNILKDTEKKISKILKLDVLKH